MTNFKVVYDRAMGRLRDYRLDNLFIKDEDAVAVCRLKKAYENLLSAEKMEELTRATDEQVITLYKSASSIQKELIIEYFAGRKANGEDVSHNILYQLGELSGKKLID